jgi:hypothetical protein
MLRHHVNAAFSCARIGVEAALYGAMMSGGYMTEDQYLFDDKKRSGMSREARTAVKAGKQVPRMVSFLLESMDFLSSVGPHADPKAWGRSMTTTETTVSISMFQPIDDDNEFQNKFLNLLWHTSMALQTFLDIAKSDFAQDTGPLSTRLKDWKAQCEVRRSELAIV